MTPIKKRHCPRCYAILAAHVTLTLEGEEDAYVEHCATANCNFSRRRKLKKKN